LRLSTRFFLAASVLSVLPVGASAVLVGRAQRSEFEAGFDRRVAELAGRVASEYRRTAGSLRSALVRLEGDRLLDRALLLAAGAGGTAALDEAPRTMATLGLDVLTLARTDGTVLAAGHLPGLSGLKVAVGKPPWGPQIRRESVRGASGLDRALFLEVARPLERHGQRLVVIGGRRLDRGFLRRLLPDESAALVLLDAGGRTVARVGGEPQGPSRSIELSGGRGARLSLTVDRAALDLTLSRLVRTAGWLAGAGVVLSLLASLLLARRLSRPLSELVDGVRAVAAGNLDARLDERGPAEVRALVVEFNRMAADLSESRLRLRHAERVAAWRDVARRIAHEVRNPLSPLRMAMETLRKAWRRQLDSFPELLDESTTTVLEEVDRLNRLVTSFSRFAKMPAPEPVSLDLGETVGAALALQAEALPDGVSLESELARAVRAWADRDQVTQVVVNLVKNASEALEGDGGSIRVTVDRDARGRPRLTVADDGQGLPESVADDPFVPYRTTKERGSGLGLAEVQRIAVDHGGEVRHVAPEAGGCRFEVVLPSHA